MSFPNIPDIDPKIELNTNDIVNLLLASIAFEELGLAHIINAEAEKIQSVLGTLEGQSIKNPSIDDLERINKSVEKILKDVIKKEMLLEFKLEEVLSISTSSTSSTTTRSTTSTTTRSTTSTTTSSTTSTTTSTTTRSTTSTTTRSTTSSSTTRSTTTRCHKSHDISADSSDFWGNETLDTARTENTSVHDDFWDWKF